MKAYTFTASINAYTLYKAAKALNIEVFTTEENPSYPIPYQTPDNEQAWLLFTEEHTLGQALQGQLIGRFLPPQFPPSLLDDKWAFAAWLASNKDLPAGLRQWAIDDKPPPAFPCLLKAKHSWQGSIKLPRGWICRSEHDVQQHLQQVTKMGLSYQAFFFQEWLGDQDHQNISVCGFHDSQNHSRNTTAIVKRLLSHHQGLSCAAMVETIPDQWDLRTKTTQVLDALAFVGPYELEFMVAKGQVVILELNPRFWMQHAIFLASGNGLLKRYFALDSIADQQHQILENIVWIDGLYFTKAILTGRWQILRLYTQRRFLARRKTLIWPPLRTSVFTLVRRFLSKLAFLA